MKILYRLYVVLFLPLIFMTCGVIVILQVIISPLIWVITWKGMFDFKPLWVILLKKLLPWVYEYIFFNY